MKSFNVSMLALLMVPSFAFAAGNAKPTGSVKPTPVAAAPAPQASMFSRLVRSMIGMPKAAVRTSFGAAVSALDVVARIEAPVVNPLVSKICSVRHQVEVKRAVAALTVAAAAYAVYNYTKGFKCCPFSGKACTKTAQCKK